MPVLKLIQQAVLKIELCYYYFTAAHMGTRLIQQRRKAWFTKISHCAKWNESLVAVNPEEI